jgi:hypothetical protein
MSVTDGDQGRGSCIELSLQLFGSAAGQEHGDVVHGILGRNSAAFGERQELLGPCQLRVFRDLPYRGLGVCTGDDHAQQRRKGQARRHSREAFHGA